MTESLKSGEYHWLSLWRPLPKEFQRCLMSDDTSRHNKLWLLTSWLRTYDFYWKWQGEPFRSRMMFAFDPSEPYKPARSYEEDILPTLDLAGRVSHV